METYHYHLDMLIGEDEYIAYKESFSIAILRSFCVNFFQLFLNENKGKKVLITGKIIMADIKRSCIHSDDFAIGLFT